MALTTNVAYELGQGELLKVV